MGVSAVRKIACAVFFFLFLYALGRPYIAFNVSAESDAEFVGSYAVGSVISSDRFYVLLKDALKITFKELKLQDLFTSDEILTGEVVESEYYLFLKVEEFTVNVTKKRVRFLKDDFSGNYILYNGRYIKVHLGKWYRYDYERKAYVQDMDKGNYVKGYDGNYYLYFGNFYRYIPVDEYWINVRLKCSYKLATLEKSILSGVYTKTLNERVIWYEYDGENSRLIRYQIPESSLILKIAEGISKEIENALKKKFPIKASVLKVKDVRIVMDSGFEEGVKPGMVFKAENTLYVVREYTKAISEAEIYKLGSTTARAGSEILEVQSPPFFVPITLSGGYDLYDGFYISLGLKCVDRKWMNSAFVSFDTPLSIFLSEETDISKIKARFLFNIFGPVFGGFFSKLNGEAGLEIAGCFNFFCGYVESSLSSLSVGGEVRW